MTARAVEGPIGFIGVGSIGAPMARRLIAAGHQLVVYDLRAEALELLLELGAEAAASSAEAASRCRVLFTSLPGPPQVEAAVEGEHGILEGALVGTIHVDLSSNSVSRARRLAEVERAHGVTYLNCPVTGGVQRAAEGTLTVLGSGDAAAFEQVRPLLETIGTEVFNLGEAGTGALYKVINNVILLCGNQILQEALVLGVKSGLDAAHLVELLRLGSARPFLGVADALLAREWANPAASLSITEKDVALALELAREQLVPMPIASAAHQTYLSAMAHGHADEHYFTSLLALEAAAGIDLEQDEEST